VFWDTNADGTPDEAISLLNTPQALVQADDIVWGAQDRGMLPQAVLECPVGRRPPSAAARV